MSINKTDKTVKNMEQTDTILESKLCKPRTEENRMEDKKQTALTLAGNIDRKTFFRFAVYDTLIRKKGWRNPALFAVIM